MGREADPVYGAEYEMEIYWGAELRLRFSIGGSYSIETDISGFNYHFAPF
jgi:hypothetical protein